MHNLPRLPPALSVTRSSFANVVLRSSSLSWSSLTIPRRSSPLPVSFFSSSSLFSSSSSSSSPVSFPPMNVYYHPEYHVDLPDGHRFPMERYRKTYELLQTRLLEQQHVSSSFFSSSSSSSPVLTIKESPLLPHPMAYLAHTREYIDGYVTGTLSTDHQKRIGFPWSPEFVQRTLRITGGTVQASIDVLQKTNNVNNNRSTVSGNLAGGTHHAFQDHGEGFCIMNDIAIAIRLLQTLTRYQQPPQQSQPETKSSSSSSSSFVDSVPLPFDPILLDSYPLISPVYRAAVLDLDVHQGNGTAGIFANDPTVVTVSMHGERNYPWSTRYPSVYDVDLPDQCDDDTYLTSLYDTLAIMDGLIRLSDKDIRLIQQSNQEYAYNLGLGKEVLRFGKNSENNAALLDTATSGGRNSTPRSLRDERLPVIQALSNQRTEDSTNRSKTSGKRDTRASGGASSSLSSPSSSSSPSSFAKSSSLVRTLAMAALDNRQPIRIQCLYYQAGVDGLRYDRLGRLRLSRTGLHERNSVVYRWATERKLPLIITMGGGYSKPIEYSTLCHTDVFLQAAVSSSNRYRGP